MSAARVLIAEPIDPRARDWLAQRCAVADASDPNELGDALAKADGLVVRTYTRVDGALLERAPRLRVVGRAGVGVDNIDLEACARRGVTVVHTPDSNTGAVAELTLAFVLDALRPRVFLDGAVSPERWREIRSGLIGERQLSECVVGIVGMGRIGRAVARAVGGFGARCLYYDVARIDEGDRFGAEPAAMERLLGESDIVTLHVDDRASNRGLIGARELALLRADAVLINTARGFVVDELALAAWLRDNPSGLAILDVHDPEPVPEGAALLGLPNARLSPHIGAATRAAKRAMSWVVEDVWRVLEGEAPAHEAARSGG